MTLRELTRRSVLDAVAECDQVGRAAFLAKHGFRSGEYLLLHDGRRYDSKAIAGVAHRYATGRPLPAHEFSGGAATVKPALERLGFEVVHADPPVAEDHVTPRRNPSWTRDEVILACDLVVKNLWRELRTHAPEVQELSRLLRSMDIHGPETRLDNFRSPDSVSRKTTDLMTAHPAYTGASTRGGRMDRQVVQEFIDDPSGMSAAAAAIRATEAEGITHRARRPGVNAT